jgi:hypothetical protein
MSIYLSRPNGYRRAYGWQLSAAEAFGLACDETKSGESSLVRIHLSEEVEGTADGECRKNGHGLSQSAP